MHSRRVAGAIVDGRMNPLFDGGRGSGRESRRATSCLFRCLIEVSVIKLTINLHLKYLGRRDHSVPAFADNSRLLNQIWLPANRSAFGRHTVDPGAGRRAI